MKLLVTTSIPIEQLSAPITRLRRMRLSLQPFGIELILAGKGDFVESSWKLQETSGFSEVLYNANAFPFYSYSNALKISGQAGKFYRKSLPELFSVCEVEGVISYSPQYQEVDPVFRYCKLEKKTIVADMVEWFDWGGKYFLNGVNYQQWLLSRRILPNLNGILGVSHFWCDWANNAGVPSVWIPSFAEDMGFVQPEKRPSNKPFTLTFIGHWLERELPRTILRAIRLCLNRGISIQMNVLGDIGKNLWERKAMKFVSEDPVLYKHVHFLGFVSNEEKERQLANADAFVILRNDCRETDALFPTRLPEYMLTGNPVVLSAVGSFAKCFKHKRDVWFISPDNNIKDLADAFIYLSQHPKERKEIGQRGRESALHQFSMYRLGKRLAEFLKMVVAQN